MYTRHTSLNIPKNYSGNRFSKIMEEPTVKEHRPVYTDAVKTAHSPAYNEEITRAEDIIIEKEEEEIIDSVAEEIEEQPESIRDTSSEMSQQASSFSLPINEILNGIDKEELLLLGLIILIAAEKNNDNNIILTLLSLLLLSK